MIKLLANISQMSKIEVLSDFEIQSSETRQVQAGMVSTLEQIQVRNGTGPGVRRSKRPLFASCTRCKYYTETSRNLLIRPRSVMRSISLKLYCRYLYTWPCMINHIWGLKQL